MVMLPPPQIPKILLLLLYVYIYVCIYVSCINEGVGLH